METSTHTAPPVDLGRLVRQSWMPIDSAPKNGTEILVWREDAGTLLARWIAPAEFMTESELADWSEEEAWESDWFYADFIEGGRLEHAPTHWTHLPCMPNN
jgi:hypothetical protein